jgi:excisionase family DNA binding protein
MSDNRLVYNLWPEVGEKLGISRPAVYAAAQRGEIPTIKIGRLLKVPKAAFDQMLDKASSTQVA